MHVPSKNLLPECSYGPFQPTFTPSKALYTSEFILLLLSVVASSANISESVPLAAIHVHAIMQPLPCLTRDTVGFGSPAVLLLGRWIFCMLRRPGGKVVKLEA